MAFGSVAELVRHTWIFAKRIFARIRSARADRTVPDSALISQEFPAIGLRGIRSGGHVKIDAGKPAEIKLDVFLPNTGKGAAVREDGFTEASVNWCDGDGDQALVLLQADRSNSAHGIARFSVEQIRIAMQLVNKGSPSRELDIERRPVVGNPYHGNILYAGTLPKNRIKAIANTIAELCTSGYIPPSGSGTSTEK